MSITNASRSIRAPLHAQEGAIHVLPDDIANVIAAGEVVERPASVVRELVDNSLDAGATAIEVMLEDAGKSYIAVRDDGHGMREADVSLALQAHATSKIHSLDDLHAIQTLGFRGEALPSIAAASELRLTSRHSDEDVGTRVISEERGTVVSVQKVASAVGTHVEVMNLFAALPARQKFLKGDRTELSHIQDLLTRVALANPQCRLTLKHGKRRLISCQHQGELHDRVTELFGTDVMKQLNTVEADGAAVLRGYCGAPSMARPGSSQIYMYINGRAVRDRVLTHAVMEAYRTFIPRGEQPFVILFISLDPSEVDVNVHPAKAEVRLANSGAVYSMIKHALRKVLESANVIRDEGAIDVVGSVQAHSATSYAATSKAMSSRPTALQVQEAMALYERPAPRDDGEFPSATAPQRDEQPPQWRSLGQLNTTYLLFEGRDGSLCVVDQHAAHERLGYERFKREWLAGGVERQALLTPEVINLEPAQAEVLCARAEELLRFGFELSDFGDGSVAVHSVPTLLRKTDLPSLLSAVAEDLRAERGVVSLESRMDHILMTMACHRMVRAGDTLHAEEAISLLEQMRADSSMDRCPHGRPTWIRFSNLDIEKWFKRS